MTTPVEAKLFSNISATTAAFTLLGGAYLVACVATFGGGSVDLQVLGPDQTTWMATPAATHFTANGIIGPVYVPPGQYRFLITTASAVFVSVAEIPLD
jgi:hypothetical protein